MKNQITKCNCCGEKYDMSNLSDVFYHAFNTCATNDQKENLGNYSYKQVGEPIQYTKDKQELYLN